METSDSDRLARLERRVDYLIKYLGIDPAHIAAGVMPAGFPAGLPTGDGMPPWLDLAPSLGLAAADETAEAAFGPVC